MSFDPQATIVRNNQAIEASVGEEVVLMTLDSGSCFGLGDTGSAVWRLLEQPTSLDNLVRTLTQTYDAPADLIRSDVAELLERMLALKLIHLQA